MVALEETKTKKKNGKEKSTKQDQNKCNQCNFKCTNKIILIKYHAAVWKYLWFIVISESSLPVNILGLAMGSLAEVEGSCSQGDSPVLFVDAQQVVAAGLEMFC